MRAISPASIDRTGLEVDGPNTLKARPTFNSAPLALSNFAGLAGDSPHFSGGRARSGVAVQRSAIGSWGDLLGFCQQLLEMPHIELPHNGLVFGEIFDFELDLGDDDDKGEKGG